MKDPIFILMFLFLLSFVFKRPYIGVCIWAWTALLYPNYLLYGFASAIRFNFLVSFLTLAVVLFTYFKGERLNNRTFYVMLFLVIWMVISTIAAIGDPIVVNEGLVTFLKIFALFVMVLLAIHKKIHVNTLLFSILLGIGYYIVTEGLKAILSGGSHRVWGPGQSVIGDNNHFALGILITFPLILFLYRNAAQHKYVKWMLGGVLLVSLAAVFGTYSRGGLVGMIFMLGLYSIAFKKKLIMGAIGFVALSSAAAFVPQEWMERMDTIQSADEDGSFMGRVVAWKISTLVAMDHPLTGGGFDAIEQYPIWLSYSLVFDDLDFIETRYPDPDKAHAAHSIYFQMLGEHGFVGLFLFLLVFLFGLLNVLRSKRQLKKFNIKDRWHKELADCLFISLLTYMLVGAALNLAYFDMLYLIVALTQVQLGILAIQVNKKKAELKQAKDNALKMRLANVAG